MLHSLLSLGASLLFTNMLRLFLSCWVLIFFNLASLAISLMHYIVVSILNNRIFSVHLFVAHAQLSHWPMRRICCFEKQQYSVITKQQEHRAYATNSALFVINCASLLITNMLRLFLSCWVLIILI